MKNNKGFTLIELLAVIVILAIIALIATPIVLNIINSSRESSNERSIELYAGAIKNAIAQSQLKENINEIVGTYTSSTLPVTVSYTGDVDCQTIEIYESGNIYLAECKVNGVEVSYEYGNKSNITQTDTLCKKDSGVDLSNLKYGDKFVCKVGENIEKTFYLLEISGDNVSLILNQNIASGTVAWGNEPDNSGEPNIALKYLAENTSDWTNIDQSKISMPTVEQVSIAGGNTDLSKEYWDFELAAWLDENSASYWLKDGLPEGYAYYFASGDRKLYQDHIGVYESIGVRPIIIISKTELS